MRPWRGEEVIQHLPDSKQLKRKGLENPGLPPEDEESILFITWQGRLEQKLDLALHNLTSVPSSSQTSG